MKSVFFEDLYVRYEHRYLKEKYQEQNAIQNFFKVESTSSLEKVRCAVALVLCAIAAIFDSYYSAVFKESWLTLWQGKIIRLNHRSGDCSLQQSPVCSLQPSRQSPPLLDQYLQAEETSLLDDRLTSVSLSEQVNSVTAISSRDSEEAAYEVGLKLFLCGDYALKTIYDCFGSKITQESKLSEFKMSVLFGIKGAGTRVDQSIRLVNIEKETDGFSEQARLAWMLREIKKEHNNEHNNVAIVCPLGDFYNVIVATAYLGWKEGYDLSKKDQLQYLIDNSQLRHFSSVFEGQYSSFFSENWSTLVRLLNKPLPAYSKQYSTQKIESAISVIPVKMTIASKESEFFPAKTSAFSPRTLKLENTPSTENQNSTGEWRQLEENVFPKIFDITEHLFPLMDFARQGLGALARKVPATRAPSLGAFAKNKIFQESNLVLDGLYESWPVSGSHPELIDVFIDASNWLDVDEKIGDHHLQTLVAIAAWTSNLLRHTKRVHLIHSKSSDAHVLVLAALKALLSSSRNVSSQYLFEEALNEFLKRYGTFVEPSILQKILEKWNCIEDLFTKLNQLNAALKVDSVEQQISLSKTLVEVEKTVRWSQISNEEGDEVLKDYMLLLQKGLSIQIFETAKVTDQCNNLIPFTGGKAIVGCNLGKHQSQIMARVLEDLGYSVEGVIAGRNGYCNPCLDTDTEHDIFALKNFDIAEDRPFFECFGKYRKSLLVPPGAKINQIVEIKKGHSEQVFYQNVFQKIIEDRGIFFAFEGSALSFAHQMAQIVRRNSRIDLRFSRFVILKSEYPANYAESDNIEILRQMYDGYKALFDTPFSVI